MEAPPRRRERGLAASTSRRSVAPIAHAVGAGQKHSRKAAIGPGAQHLVVASRELAACSIGGPQNVVSRAYPNAVI